MRITKKLRRQIDERNQVLSAFLADLGARIVQQSTFGTEFELNTPAGPWMLTLYDNWIATRFVSHRGYELATGQRSTNSKWNLHFEHRTPAADVLSQLSWRVRQALDCEPCTADRAAIQAEVAESEERRQYLRAYLEQQFGARASAWSSTDRTTLAE